MSEGIYVNYLNVKGRPFVGFEVIARPTIVTKPVKDNMRSMYILFTQLSSMGVADVDFRRNTIFVRGNDEEVAKWLKESGVAFVGVERNNVRLELDRDLNIIRALFYRAFSRYANKKGFKMLWGKRKGRWKKLLPFGIDLEELIDQELAIRIGNELVLYRGLYIMLEVFNDGGAVLWVDLYSPIVKLSEQRPLSPKEAKNLGLRDTHTSYIPTPIKRLELTNKLLGILCEGSELNIMFADGYSISFTCSFPMLKVM